MFKLIRDGILYSSILVGVVAVALTLATFLIVERSMANASSEFLLFVFSASIFIYNLDIVAVDPKRKGLNEKEKWKLDHKGFVYVLMILCLIGVIPAAFMFSKSEFLFLFHLGIISVAYVVPIRIKGNYLIIRRLPFVKIFLISYVWSAMTVLMPYWNVINVNEHDLLLLFIERFVFIFALTLPFDIRDYARDREEQLITFASWLGIYSTIRLSIFILFLLQVVTFLIHGFVALSVCRLACFSLAAFLISQLFKSKDEYYYLIGIDGLYLVYFISLYITQFV